MSTPTLITPFEKNNNYSAAYDEIISHYETLSAKYSEIQCNKFGQTDIGKPLHEIIISSSKVFDPIQIKKSGKTVLFINNGIHPGEPCGIDASMMLVRDLVDGTLKNDLLQNLVIVVVPVYNVGGCLNRGPSSRANQEGPELYGFRGNAKNLDLNRDFIKCDSKNAQSFNKLFNKWNPSIMIDNHTSNGADYQYTMTLIATQKDKLSKPLSQLMVKEMIPYLYQKMKKKKWEMTPYVYSRSTPDEGIAGFLDLPRYSSGYATLHNTISFMPETHMLKPYKDRVLSTYAFMTTMLEYLEKDHSKVIVAKKKADSNYNKNKNAALNWTMDMEKVEELKFKGFEASYKPSEVTGHSRLFYDRSKKYNKKVPFYNTYKASLNVEVPKKYIIPQAYHDVIQRLKWNGVEMTQLKKDSVVSGQLYYISDYSSVPRPYEGHFLHKDVELEIIETKKQYYAGDFIVATSQEKQRYIVETLEPHAPDSFFAWNFFDGILMQKEYFSPYVFEDLAKSILKKDKKLRKAFEAKKKEDSAFSEDPNAQLRFIYERSPHYEQTFQQYPVMRIL